jgi:hypothetical protein
MTMPIPIIASDMTITSTSIVSHVGMRFAGWVIACALAAHVMSWVGASGYERGHMPGEEPNQVGYICRPGWVTLPAAGDIP